MQDHSVEKVIFLCISIDPTSAMCSVNIQNQRPSPRILIGTDLVFPLPPPSNISYGFMSISDGVHELG